MYCLGYSTWKEIIQMRLTKFYTLFSCDHKYDLMYPKQGRYDFLQYLLYQLTAQKKVAIYFSVHTHYRIIVVDEGSNGVRNFCLLGIQQECLADIYKWKSFNRCYLYFFNDIILRKESLAYE